MWRAGAEQIPKLTVRTRSHEDKHQDDEHCRKLPPAEARRPCRAEIPCSMTILSRHTDTRREGRFATAIMWAWIILSALVRRGNRADGQREDPALVGKPLAASPRPEPAVPPREPRRRGRLERVALWTQVIGLPLAVAGLIYAGLAYSRQADETQQALAAIQVQQHEVSEQQRTIAAIQASISAQVAQLEATRLSVTAQEDLTEAVHQLAALLMREGGTP